MFLWFYGLAFSLSYWFVVLQYTLIIQLLPLIIAASFSFLRTIHLLREKQKVSIHVGGLSTAILLILLFATKPDNMYLIFSVVFGIIVVLMVVANIDTLFLATPSWLAGANALSLFVTVVIYVLLYGSIQDHIHIIYIFFPMAIVTAIEAYVILNIKNMPSLCDEMKNRLRRERLAYFIALLIVISTNILYATKTINVEVNLFICTLCYLLGLLYASYEKIINAFKNQSTKSPSIYTLVLNTDNQL